MYKINCLSAVAFAVALFGAGSEAEAACTLTYTLTNGTTADATQVMQDFSDVLGCTAPLASPHFTGNVGIGTTDTTTNIWGPLVVQGGSSGTVGMTLNSGSTNSVGLLFNTSPSGIRNNRGGITANNSGTLSLSGGDMAGDLNINSSGHVGIGTTSPARALDVSTNGQITFGDNGYSSSGSPGMFWYNTNTDYGIYKTAGTWSMPNYQQLELNFATGIIIDGGTSYARSGTILQPNGGNVGIGTSSPAVTLTVVGDARVGTSGTNGCLQNFAGTALAGTCSSDTALKMVTGKVTQVLDKLASLELVTFHWNRTAAALYHNSTATQNTGFIAQSVERPFPELVTMDSHGYRQLDYTTLELYGLEAIKELKIADNARDGAITDLRDRLKRADERVTNLERKNREMADALRKIQADITLLRSDKSQRTASR